MWFEYLWKIPQGTSLFTTQSFWEVWLAGYIIICSEKRCESQVDCIG